MAEPQNTPDRSASSNAANSSAQTPENSGKNNSGRAFWVVFLIVLLAASPFLWREIKYVHAHETTDDAFIEGHIIEVSPRIPGIITQVLVHDNQEVRKGQLLAVIGPRDFQVQVDRARAALQLAKEQARAASQAVALTSVTTNADVDLAAASVDASQSNVEKAQSAVQVARDTAGAAEARLQQALAQVATARHTYAQALAQIPAAQAEASRTSEDRHRYAQLYAQDEVSRQQLDNAVAASREAAATLMSVRRRADAAGTAVGEAQAQAQAARQGVAQARSQIRESDVVVQETQAQVGEAKARLAAANSAPQQVAVKITNHRAARADIQGARVALEAALLNLSYTRIYSPETGRVTHKSVEIGQYVQPGQALLAVVPHNVWVVANFKETQLDRMKPGQPVDVFVDAFPGRVFKAHVDSIQDGSGARFSLLPPENATGNHVKIVQRVPVKIVFNEQPGVQLGPGMSVEPEVDVH